MCDSKTTTKSVFGTRQGSESAEERGFAHGTVHRRAYMNASLTVEKLGVDCDLVGFGNEHRDKRDRTRN